LLFNQVVGYGPDTGLYIGTDLDVILYILFFSGSVTTACFFARKHSDTAKKSFFASICKYGSETEKMLDSVPVQKIRDPDLLSWLSDFSSKRDCESYLKKLQCGNKVDNIMAPLQA